MALDKAIKHGREHRKPYRKSKAVDGSCPHCQKNRKHKRQEPLED